jgi:hypothetical protein
VCVCECGCVKVAGQLCVKESTGVQAHSRREGSRAGKREGEAQFTDGLGDMAEGRGEGEGEGL